MDFKKRNRINTIGRYLCSAGRFDDLHELQRLTFWWITVSFCIDDLFERIEDHFLEMMGFKARDINEDNQMA